MFETLYSLSFRRLSCIAFAGALNTLLLLCFLTSSVLPVPQWRVQFLILMGVSILLTAAVVTSDSVAYRVLFSVAKVLVVGVMMIPALADGYLRVLLAVSMGLEIGLLLPQGMQAITAIVGAIMLIAPPAQTLVWDRSLSLPAQGENGRLLGLYMVCVVLCVLVRLITDHADDLRQNNEQRGLAVNNLARINAELQDSIAQLERRVLSDERNRVSRELHDVVGYTMTSQIMTMEAALRLTEHYQEELREVLHQAREASADAMREIRLAMRDLRDTNEQLALDLWSIDKLAAAFRSTEVRVRVEYRNALSRFPSHVQKIVYRFVQEGITNAIQHGHATVITVLFWQEHGNLLVTVVDDGGGSSKLEEGIGLQGIRERLDAMGGRFSCFSGQRGFTIRAFIPLKVVTHA